MEKEEWKPIPNYEGLYQVSSLGRVKSLNYNRTCKEKILKPHVNGSGYYHVGISKDGKPKSIVVHKLVAIAFLNHTPCGMELVIDHINDDKLDNRVENLQIITNRDNSFKTQGRYSSKYKGVYWNKQAKKWQSSIKTNGKSTHLGVFNCELEASQAYQNKLKEILC